jgi:predicted oxidoreductase
MLVGWLSHQTVQLMGILNNIASRVNTATADCSVLVRWLSRHTVQLMGILNIVASRVNTATAD